MLFERVPSHFTPIPLVCPRTCRGEITGHTPKQVRGRSRYSLPRPEATAYRAVIMASTHVPLQDAKLPSVDSTYSIRYATLAILTVITVFRCLRHISFYRERLSMPKMGGDCHFHPFAGAGRGPTWTTTLKTAVGCGFHPLDGSGSLSPWTTTPRIGGGCHLHPFAGGGPRLAWTTTSRRSMIAIFVPSMGLVEGWHGRLGRKP